jgi:hypothetical protein
MRTEVTKSCTRTAADTNVSEKVIWEALLVTGNVGPKTKLWTHIYIFRTVAVLFVLLAIALFFSFLCFAFSLIILYYIIIIIIFTIA